VAYAATIISYHVTNSSAAIGHFLRYLRQIRTCSISLASPAVLDLACSRCVRCVRFYARYLPCVALRTLHTLHALRGSLAQNHRPIRKLPALRGLVANLPRRVSYNKVIQSRPSAKFLDLEQKDVTIEQ